MQIHEYIKRGDLAGVRAELARGVSIEASDGALGLFTPLMAAAISNAAGLEMLAELLNRGADPNAADASTSVLGLAARAGRVDKMRLLLARGARADARTSSNYTALINATSCPPERQDEVIDLLLDAGGDPNVVTPYGESVLSIFSRSGRFCQIARLLDRGVDPSPLEWTPLHRAAAIGTVADVERLAKAYPASMTAQDAWSRTPFVVATMSGDLAKVETLLPNQDLSVTGRCGRTILAYPVVGDHDHILNCLLKAGADINAMDDFGYPAMVQAVESNALRCVAALIAAGAPIRGVAESTADTALDMIRDMQPRFAESIEKLGIEFTDEHRAETVRQFEHIAYEASQWHAIDEARSLEMIRLLLAAGASIDQVSGSGDWPLSRAAQTGDLSLVQSLLGMGANVNTTSTGATALHAAVQSDSLDIVRLLIDRGADVQALDVDGWSALFYVQSVEMIDLMLAAGADPDHRDDCGNRADQSIRDNHLREALAIRLGKSREKGE